MMQVLLQFVTTGKTCKGVKQYLHTIKKLKSQALFFLVARYARQTL